MLAGTTATPVARRAATKPGALAFGIAAIVPPLTTGTTEEVDVAFSDVSANSGALDPDERTEAFASSFVVIRTFDNAWAGFLNTGVSGDFCATTSEIVESLPSVLFTTPSCLSLFPSVTRSPSDFLLSMERYSFRSSPNAGTLNIDDLKGIQVKYSGRNREAVLSMKAQNSNLFS